MRIVIRVLCSLVFPLARVPGKAICGGGRPVLFEVPLEGWLPIGFLAALRSAPRVESLGISS